MQTIHDVPTPRFLNRDLSEMILHRDSSAMIAQLLDCTWAERFVLTTTREARGQRHMTERAELNLQSLSSKPQSGIHLLRFNAEHLFADLI